MLLDFNFAGGTQPPCVSACDVDSNGRIQGSITDAVYMLRFSFLGGSPPAAPYPDCGTGTDVDALLGCEEPPRSCP